MTLLQFFPEFRSYSAGKESGKAAAIQKQMQGNNNNDSVTTPPPPPKSQPVEFGTIQYVNHLLPGDFRHGSYERALAAGAALRQETENNKPLFCNFVEYPGCAGVCEAGQEIFSHPVVVSAIHEAFTPVFFNTWDKRNPAHNAPMQAWGGDLADSDWGFVRIVYNGNDGNINTVVIAGTERITGKSSIDQVVACLILALEELNMPVPPSLNELARQLAADDSS